MKGHIHTDIIAITTGAVGVFATAHVARMVGAYMAGHGFKTFGTALGAFFTVGGR